MDKKTQTIILGIVLAAAISVAGTGFAAENCKMNPIATKPPQTDWPASPLTSQNLGEETGIAQMVQYFFEWGVGIGRIGGFYRV